MTNSRSLRYEVLVFYNLYLGNALSNKAEDNENLA